MSIQRTVTRLQLLGTNLKSASLQTTTWQTYCDRSSWNRLMSFLSTTCGPTPPIPERQQVAHHALTRWAVVRRSAMLTPASIPRFIANSATDAATRARMALNKRNSSHGVAARSLTISRNCLESPPETAGSAESRYSAPTTTALLTNRPLRAAKSPLRQMRIHRSKPRSLLRCAWPARSSCATCIRLVSICFSH